MTGLSASPGLSFRFSRMRSNTTIVSCTENPMMVSTAVTKRLSTSTFKKKPRIAKMPSRMRASCSKAKVAASLEEIFHERVVGACRERDLKEAAALELNARPQATDREKEDARHDEQRREQEVPPLALDDVEEHG